MHSQLDFLNRALDHMSAEYFVKQNVIREIEVEVHIADTIESRKIRGVFGGYKFEEDSEERIMVIPIGPHYRTSNTIILLNDGTNLSLIVDELKNVHFNGSLYVIIPPGVMGNPTRARLFYLPNKINASFGVDSPAVNGYINFYIDKNNVFHHSPVHPNRSITVSISSNYAHMYLANDGQNIIHTEKEYHISEYCIVENSTFSHKNTHKVYIICQNKPFVLILRKPISFKNRISEFMGELFSDNYANIVDLREGWRDHTQLNWKKRAQNEFTDEFIFEGQLKTTDMALYDQYKYEKTKKRVYSFDQYSLPITDRTPYYKLNEPYIKVTVPNEVDRHDITDDTHGYIVTVEPQDYKISIGERIKFYLAFDGNRLVTGSVSMKIDDNTLGVFRSDGFFEAKKEGVGLITMNYHEVEASTPITIEARRVVLHPVYDEIEYYKCGIILRLDIDGISIPQNLIDWNISDSSVAYIDYFNYTLEGMKPGEITITARYKDQLYEKRFRFKNANSILYGPTKGVIAQGERTNWRMELDGIPVTRFCDVRVINPDIVYLDNPIYDRRVLVGTSEGVTPIVGVFRNLEYTSNLSVSDAIFLGDTNINNDSLGNDEEIDKRLIAPQPLSPKNVTLRQIDIPTDVNVFDRRGLDDRLRSKLAVYVDGRLFITRHKDDILFHYEKGHSVVLIKASLLVNKRVVSVMPKFVDYREMSIKIKKERNSTIYLPAEFPTYKNVKFHIDGIYLEPDVDYEVFEYLENYYFFSKRITRNTSVVTLTYNLYSEEDDYVIDELSVVNDDGLKVVRLLEHNYDDKEIYLNGMLLVPEFDYIHLDYKTIIILKENTTPFRPIDGKLLVINYGDMAGESLSDADNNSIIQLSEQPNTREVLRSIQRNRMQSVKNNKDNLYNDIGYKKHLFFTLYLEQIKAFNCDPFSNPHFKRIIDLIVPGILEADGITLVYDAKERIYPRDIQLPFIHKETESDGFNDDYTDGLYKAVSGRFITDELNVGE
ncbi:MAG: hypothetical protein ACRCZ9_08280 [Fusobacteriaceae bacterium]